LPGTPAGQSPRGVGRQGFMPRGVGHGQGVAQPPGPGRRVTIDDAHLDPWFPLQDLQEDGGQLVDRVLGRHATSAPSSFGDGRRGQPPFREVSSTVIARRSMKSVATTRRNSATRAMGFSSIASRNASPPSPNALTPEKVAM